MIVFTDHAKDKLLKETGKLGITERTVIEIVRNPDSARSNPLPDK